jgi:pyrimidine deaminase RibD-like protein
MELAIKAARESHGDLSSPRVGAVAVSKGELIGTAYRGEIKAGEHAEFTLLERHLPEYPLAGTTVYTTLEPCTKRNPGKIPCATRLIQRKIGKCVIGMLDPNPLVSGLGFRMLREANIIAVPFPPDLMAQLEELNRDFIQAIKSDAVLTATQEITDLAKRSGIARQKEMSGAAVRDCLESLQRINHGELRIPGREAGYFKRFLERVDEALDVEQIKAFIRLTPFEPGDLSKLSWFEEFYSRLNRAVENGKVVIEYIFLIRTPTPTGDVKGFIDQYKQFARRIAILDEKDPRLSADMLRPSIVLFETQAIAFTHDRGADSSLLEATEWVCKDHFEKLQGQYRRIELISTPYFQQD